MGYVLAVAVLTWGGVFVYILRLEKLARSVEADVRRVEAESASSTPSPPLSTREKELV